MENEKNKMKIFIKILVSIGLFLLLAGLMVLFIKGGSTGLTNNIVKLFWIIVVEMLICGFLFKMFFPKDLKTYPAKKKLIVGIIAVFIFMILFFAFFLISAFFWEKLSMN